MKTYLHFLVRNAVKHVSRKRTRPLPIELAFFEIPHFLLVSSFLSCENSIRRTVGRSVLFMLFRLCRNQFLTQTPGLRSDSSVPLVLKHTPSGDVKPLCVMKVIAKNCAPAAADPIGKDLSGSMCVRTRNMTSCEACL